MTGLELIDLITDNELEDFEFGVNLTDEDAEYEYETLFDGTFIKINYRDNTVHLSATHKD